MSRRNKLQKFAEILTFPNVYENFDSFPPRITGADGQEIKMKGHWKEKHFKNDNPITLELACGRGEYTVALAEKYPGRNFIGVDIKGARIWKGAKIALAKNLTNAAFLRTRIELITAFFEQGEIDEIWITFPDPFLRKGKSNRRLTSPNFLTHYRKILKKDGLMHLKTDEGVLSEFTLEFLAEDDQAKIVYQDDDIYAKPLPMEELEVKTYYERMHLEKGKTIKYIRFTIN
ncbi:MAG: tRNA (guanosine(46)-N7)-methyltransferase TrmB [Bacteroidota bacterium]